MEIPNGKIFHEPYGIPYYFGPERVSYRYRNQNTAADATFDSVTSKLTNKYPEHDFVFVKDMAYYLKGRYSTLLSEDLMNFSHSFLIRNPERAIPSLYRASVNEGRTGWTYFDESEAGFQEMYELYKILVDSGKTVTVIDCDDLLSDPETMMKLYCSAVGLKFKPGMTRWEPGPQPDWDVWQGWHNDALNSTGLHPPQPQRSSPKADEPVPEEVLQAARKAVPSYLELYELRLRPPCER